MKVAIYTVEGTTQIVLTPDGKFEEAALAHLHAPHTKLTVMRGEFYECRGGWYRESQGDQSTMLRIDRVEAVERPENDTHPPANLEQTNLNPETPQASSGKEGG